MTTIYSSPGIPFKVLREMSDAEILRYLQNGAILHFQEQENRMASVRFQEGEWVYTFQGARHPQHFKNILQLVFRMNGLGVGMPTLGGEDMDVTLECGE